MLFAFFISYIG